MNYQNQGANTSEVFKGNTDIESVSVLYDNSKEKIVNFIRNNFSVSRQITVLDAGSYQGELFSEVSNLLPEYKIEIIAIDINEKALKENKTADKKIVADLRNIPLEEDSVDMVVSRYVLQWNMFSVQKEIVRELCRVSREFVFIQHVGSPDNNKEPWRSNIDKIFSSKELLELYRDKYFFTSPKEIASVLANIDNISYEKTVEEFVQPLSDIFVARYDLNKKKENILKQALASFDYIVKTDWLIKNF